MIGAYRDGGVTFDNWRNERGKKKRNKKTKKKRPSGRSMVAWML